jgi:hypothetical protein
MTGDTKPDLVALCAACAAELEDATGLADGAAAVYTREGVEFARVEGATLRVRLPVDIAEAALNTPATKLDPDDRGWLMFSPSSDERHVIDRATAWFRLAWKHANDH